MENAKKNKKLTEFKITKEGSLGLLAYGDIGLREWRKVRNAILKEEGNKSTLDEKE
ncbi:hypothetical protein [Constantimarinum furrinae]|uniref:Uncharacterized protein n=1 Tax=Constantimarinum furrinae TaxID=2562285 RepID=A0A7G8PRI9_9FLAO|nr:hypothetical protein [Constantimarinum furrinae]QNJ96955.1 hypothetical protein ALE3EI_0368 [Constantimarinum furrinae]